MVGLIIETTRRLKTGRWSKSFRRDGFIILAESELLVHDCAAQKLEQIPIFCLIASGACRSRHENDELDALPTGHDEDLRLAALYAPGSRRE